MTEELLPCPFCGEKAAAEDAYNVYGTEVYHFVRCQSCSSHSRLYQHRAEAITAWNTRHEK